MNSWEQWDPIGLHHFVLSHSSSLLSIAAYHAFKFCLVIVVFLEVQESLFSWATHHDSIRILTSASFSTASHFPIAALDVPSRASKVLFKITDHVFNWTVIIMIFPVFWTSRRCLSSSTRSHKNYDFLILVKWYLDHPIIFKHVLPCSVTDRPRFSSWPP